MTYEEALRILIRFSEVIADGSWLYLSEDEIDQIQKARNLVDGIENQRLNSERER